ncbi:hypothetical protein [Frigoriglobus tundricola]|uniref:Zinc-finger domain-containing protein n=1 Tax=Frigoriglobus tundricola TaxID=2774151 RepID=A0A6M5YY30_9BACT|nr:hypothetical protein [Frigoriglobus tundricola]QJW98905.1 hypothetical protein FTUN_6500 [Frigoriglobus tundricola]
MASDKSAPEDGPPPDPFEAELVAYLDGELDPAAARKVEARLARDGAARARAAALKKSFDMLDYLPRPEPSPTFDPHPGQVAGPETGRVGRRSGRGGPVARGRLRSGSGRRLVRLGAGRARRGRPGETRSDRLRPVLWAGGLVAAVFAFAALGFFVTAAARVPRAPTRDKAPEDAKAEVSPRVVEYLPLYALADDLAFVAGLARTDLFGDDPAVTFDPTLKVPVEVAEKAAARHSDAMTKAFHALPPARQAEIAKLDQDLFASDPKQRDHLLRALEAYAVWLERLPEGERRGVLAAATPGLRLDVIHKVRAQQWRDALPPSVRNKPELVSQWQEDEAAHRERWGFIRRHAAEFAAHRSPWPFDTEPGRKEVVEFARHAFKIPPEKTDPKSDDAKKCRLSWDELAEYRRTLAQAERDGAWAWYGLVVYELAKAHPYLPEAADPKLLITEPKELPEEYVHVLKKKTTWSFRKWPEFPLEIHRETPARKLTSTKLPPLGPARPDEFKEPVRTFVTTVLESKLSTAERDALRQAEGKWPEYPKLVVQFAKRHELSVPGVTLPGPPSRWETNYALRPRSMN